MSTWDAARIASKRPLPKPRKMMESVGRQIDANRNCMSDMEINRPDARRVWFAPGECSACQCCGYHVCSGPPW
jgi:hypothetical protein